MIAVALLKPMLMGTLWNCTEKLIINVSVPSVRLSHVTGILIDLLFSPGLNVTLKGLETKSTPDPKKIALEIMLRDTSN